jgi:uncharacterized YigZ family protein
MAGNPLRYRVPLETQRTTSVVQNSRFITTISLADSTESARSQLAAVRVEMPDANHHVYAFRIGYGNSVTEGMSDDGEPAGTAGRPVMAVLRGAEIGDTLVVVTRYFGGIKLGTGGLVRAYSDAARIGLDSLKTVVKVRRKTVGIETPYSLYQPIKQLLTQYDVVIEDEQFTGDVTIIARLPDDTVETVTAAIINLTHGRVQLILLD